MAVLTLFLKHKFSFDFIYFAMICNVHLTDVRNKRLRRQTAGSKENDKEAEGENLFVTIILV